MLQQRPESFSRPPARKSAGTRDTRLDTLRAICLLMIFVNHVPGNVLENFTTKNFGFSDAAEAFMLISGMAAGYAYGKRFMGGEWLLTTLKGWRRAGVLYVAHLSATFATLAIFAFFAIAFNSPLLMTKINMKPIMDDPTAGLLGIVTMGHQLGYNNILSMYAVILLMMPGFLLIGRWRLSAMVAASGLLWLVCGLFYVGPPNFPNEGNWFLNPLSWQFLFVIGMASTLHISRGGQLFRSPYLIAACLAYLALSAVWVMVPLWSINISFGLPSVLTGFDKTYVSVPRLLHILSLAYLIAALPWLSAAFRRAPSNPLATMGRHGLPVFILGTMLAMACQAAFFAVLVSDAEKLLIVATGIAIQFAFVAYLEWYGSFKKSSNIAAAARQETAVSQTLIGPVMPDDMRGRFGLAAPAGA